MHCRFFQRPRRSDVAVIFLLAVAAFAWGTFESAGAQEIGPTVFPSAAAARIEISEAPVIDGDLNDVAWAKATTIDNFRQLEPVVGATPSERTVVRVMYDETNIYFGIYSYDSEPELIIARSMARDGELYTGDNVTVILDPGVTRRNAYRFQMGPSGGRADSLILNNTAELEEWDPIWSARARRVVDGWVAEMAIPFSSLSFQAGSDWGFEFRREIRRKAEEIRWASQNRNLDFTDVSQTGTLTGINNISQGLGLDVQAYGVMRAKRDWHIPGEDIGLSFTGGGNIFYRVTPALTATLTYNPDFSDAPLDARQVNTTRFSLFTPETRDFFLQDAGAFEFAGRAFARGFEDRDANNGRPFFSRNIGLAGGQQVSIIGGGKLSGEHAGFSVGALSVVTDKTSEAGEQVLSVARVSKALGESRIGMIVTHGDPTGETDNSVVGGDFQFRDSESFGGGVFIADLFYQHSFSSEEGRDSSFGFAASYPSEPWFGEAAFKQIGENFTPALGFINRKAVRVYEGAFGHITRFDDQWLRQMDISTEHIMYTDLNDTVETRESEIGVEFETSGDDEFGFGITNFYEAVPETFDLPGDILVPPGAYNWNTIEASFSNSDARLIGLEIEVECCGFYDGSALQAETEIGFRPNEYYTLALTYEFSRFDMPGGQTDVHLIEAASVINFTPDMELRLQAQYDNISRDFGFLARYRWEFVPGGELFVAFGQAGRIPTSRFVAERSQFSVRVGHTFRF